jgi:hypothetical protein
VFKGRDVQLPGWAAPGASLSRTDVALPILEPRKLRPLNDTGPALTHDMFLDELEANRKNRRTAWATLQRLRKFLEEHGARIKTPEDRNFETEGQVNETGLRRTLEGRDMVMRDLIRAAYRFRDATLVAEKKNDFGSAFQNLYRELERAENLVGPS